MPAVEGLDHLLDKLDDLTYVASKTVIARGLRAGGEVLAARASELAPDDPETPGSRIKENIVVTVTEQTAEGAIAKIGPSRKGFVGQFAEFGTMHQAADPFLRPAFDEKIKEATDTIAETLSDEIDKAVRRMSIQTALVAIKTANTTLNTLIGTRFHPDVLPQEVTLPAVRFQVITRVMRDWAFQGRPDVATARVQLDGYAETDVDRATLRSALVGAFIPGTRLTGLYGGETVFDIRSEGEREGLEQLDTETEAYRISMDLIVDLVEA